MVIWVGERMFAHRAGFCKPLATGSLLLACLLLLSLAGCGSDGGAGDADRVPNPVERPGAAFVEADPEAVEVIADWSEALSRGDTEQAAELFAVPAVAENGLRFEIRSRADALQFNESLPCGATLVEAETVGERTIATFRLADRPGGDCGAGSGVVATTSFVIVDGEIAEWRRVGEGGPRPGPPRVPSRIT